MKLLHENKKLYIKIAQLVTIRHIFSTPAIIDKKICKNCKHFIGDYIECRKFGDTNIITGKITYKSARSVRDDKEKCGEDAVLYEKNHFKIITIPYYFFKDNVWVIIPISFTSMYIFVLTYALHK